MIVWLVGVFLVVLAASIGFFLGGFRAAISLVGTVVAAYAAKTVGAWLSGLVPLIGFKNPIWQFYLPPLVGFLVVSFAFLVLAVVVQHFVERHYRNSTDEYTFARWFRLNRRTGAAVGAALGTVWWILLAVVAYVPGYLTTQLADSEEASFVLRSANSFAHGMEESGLQRIVERFNPAGENHYLAADILGLVYNNPSLHSRLASYPPFLGLAEKPEIAELARDPEVNSLIQSRAGMSQILEHPKLRAVADNHELVNELLAVDFDDLEAYLRSGVSEKFKDEHILGRWRLNVRRTIAEMKLSGSEKLPPVEFNLLRRALNVYLEDLTLGFTTDNRTIVKVKAKDEQKLLQLVGGASVSTASAVATPPADGSPPPAVGTGSGMTARSIAARAVPQQQPTDSTSDLYRQRYGLGAGGAGGGAQPLAQPLASTTPYVPRAPIKPAATTTLSPLMSNGEGGWAKSGDGYRITVSREGKEIVLDAKVKENQLVARQDGRALVFDRI